MDEFFAKSFATLVGTSPLVCVLIFFLRKYMTDIDSERKFTNDARKEVNEQREIRISNSEARIARLAVRLDNAEQRHDECQKERIEALHQVKNIWKSIAEGKKFTEIT